MMDQSRGCVGSWLLKLLKKPFVFHSYFGTPALIHCSLCQAVVTRRDQLGIKRAPPSQRKNGRGRGRGRGRGKGCKAEKGAAPKPKAKAKSKSTRTKKASVPQHDVEDEEASGAETYEYEHVVKEDVPKKTRKGRSAKPKGILKDASASTSSKKPGVKSVGKDSKPRKRKAKADVVPADENVAEPPRQRRKVRTTTTDSSSSPSLRKENLVGDSRAHIINFIGQIDPGLELDGLKENVRRVVGDMGRATLNSYWTKFTCGLRWRTGRTTRDIAHFSFIRGNPGSKDLKRVVSIGCAVELVTRLYNLFLPVDGITKIF